MRALFIGRFQPFHNGHLKAVEWITKEFGDVVIGVGSAQLGLTFENPFTLGERLEMIWRSLGVVKTCAIPDTGGSSSLWGALLKHWCPQFDLIVSNNVHVRVCAEYWGYRVVEHPMYNRDVLSGTYIRNLMAKADPSWRALVPQEVSQFIDLIKGEERVRKLAHLTGLNLI